MYMLIWQKPAHFLSAQMALVSTFFQMIIVLGMYNFACYSTFYIKGCLVGIFFVLNPRIHYVQISHLII